MSNTLSLHDALPICSGIVWASVPWNADANHAVVTGVLRAYDATDMTKELWNSRQNLTRDDFGNYAKYCPPVVANGKVYMATFSNQVVAYGLIASVRGNLALDGVADMTLVNPAAVPGAFAFEFRTPGTLSDVYTASATLTPVGAGSPFGAFALQGVPAGTYDVAIKGRKNLRVALPNIVVSGVAILPDITLPGGDADGNNSVDIADFGVLINAFNGDVSMPNSGYDPAADFNYDGVIDIADFGLLFNNFGSNGAP